MSVNTTFTITQALIARPANTTVYSTGQQISNNTPDVIVFNNGFISTGGYITRALLKTNNSNQTGAVRLHLFAATPSNAAAVDQSQFVLNFSDSTNYKGFLDFTTFATAGTGSTMAVAEASFNRPFQFKTSSGVSYGLLEARAAQTPTSGQQYQIALYSELPASGI